MKKILQCAIFLSLLLAPFISTAGELPAFIDSSKKESFFPNGMQEWELRRNSEREDYFQLQWVNSSQHEITLIYRNATPNTIYDVYRGIAAEVEKELNKAGGNITYKSDYLAVFFINETEWSHSVNLLYGTPDGAYWWKYKVPITFETDYEKYINGITFVAREHQYNTALKYGNVIMGRWGGPVHEYAKLLASRHD